MKKISKVSLQEKGVEIPDQKDRSLTVMIPRAKYHPAPPTSPLMNYTTFDAGKPSSPSIAEAKLLSYLDGPAPNKVRNNKSNSVTNLYAFSLESKKHRKELMSNIITTANSSEI